jgi:hypothetical protein
VERSSDRQKIHIGIDLVPESPESARPSTLILEISVEVERYRNR